MKEPYGWYFELWFRRNFLTVTYAAPVTAILE